MKQIGLALYMYAEDYDETLPERYNNNPLDVDQWGFQQCWKDMLVPYIKSLDVYKCPSSSAAQYGTGGVAGPLPRNPHFAAGYAMYLPNFPGPEFPNGSSYPQTLAGLTYPAQELIIIENHFQWPDAGSYLWYCEASPSATDPNCPASDTEYLPGASTWSSGHAKKAANIVYMDSHAKYRHYPDTFQDDPGRGGENDWRYSYNYCHTTDPADYGWVNQTPDSMAAYPNDSGSF
jgi:hypothetical protein